MVETDAVNGEDFQENATTGRGTLLDEIFYFSDRIIVKIPCYFVFLDTSYLHSPLESVLSPKFWERVHNC